MSSRQNPLHVSSCYCCGYRFLGGLSFSRFCGNQHIRYPKSIPKQARKWIDELFCWFQVFRQHFMFLSCSFHFASFFLHVPFICMHIPFILHSFRVFCILLSCSFHLYSVPFIFLSYFFPFHSNVHWYSFSFHSNVHSCPFIFLSFACMFLSFCIHVLLFPFQSYENGSMAWPGDRVQQMVIAKLSLRLSLNNPSNIWHCSNEICHKNDRVRERERNREREREGERERERERAKK